MGVQHQPATQQPTHNMKSLFALVFLNIVVARPDHGVSHGVHHGDHQVRHQPFHHSVHQPVVHHSVAHHQPMVHHNVVPVVSKAAPKATQTIAELVVSDSRFSTLLAAVKAAGLVETLSGDGPFTVFAPTNAAF